MTYRWTVDPIFEVAEQLGLDSASGRMPLPNGGFIETHWSSTHGTRFCEFSVQSNTDIKIHAKEPCQMAG